MATAAIARGKQECLYLGNLDAKRDWGHAKDYVEAMWRILQQESPEDYVIATGKTTSIRDFVLMAFKEIGVDLKFEGKKENEIGIVINSINPIFKLEIGKVVVRVDPKYYRPTEVDVLIGDPSKAKGIGWVPKYDLEALVRDMMNHEINSSYH
jgi:GDPmannose 4,6-dehydratase